MEKKTNKWIKISFFIMLCLAVIVIGGYYYLSSRRGEDDQKDQIPTTEIDNLIAKDLETQYPGTPREVLKLYNRINRCLYNEELKNDKLEALLEQMRLLYSEELLKENSYEDQLENLKKDIKAYRSEKRTIVTTSVQKNEEVEYQTVGGEERASIVTSYMMKEKNDYTKTFEQFIMKKDDKGLWKIVGWALTDDTNVTAE